MSGGKVFTKRYFDLTHRDQSAIVDAALFDLESALGRVDSAGRKAIRRAMKRIEKKAVQCGIYEEQEASHG